MAVAYFFIKNHLYGLMAVPLIIFLDALYAYSGKKYAYNKKTNIEPLHDEPVNRKNIIETIEKRCILRQHISNAKKKIQLLVKDIRGIDKKPNCTFQKNAFTIKFIRCEQDLKFHQKKIKALDIDIKTYLKELKKKGDKHEEYCYVRDALYEHGYGLRASRLNNKYLQSYYKAYVSSLILDDTASGA
jgi:hypothetical protein